METAVTATAQTLHCPNVAGETSTKKGDEGAGGEGDAGNDGGDAGTPLCHSGEGGGIDSAALLTAARNNLTT